MNIEDKLKLVQLLVRLTLSYFNVHGFDVVASPNLTSGNKTLKLIKFCDDEQQKMNAMRCDHSMTIWVGLYIAVRSFV